MTVAREPRSFAFEAGEADHKAAEKSLGRERDEQQAGHNATERDVVRQRAEVQPSPRPEDTDNQQSTRNKREQAQDQRPLQREHAIELFQERRHWCEILPPRQCPRKQSEHQALITKKDEHDGNQQRVWTKRGRANLDAEPREKRRDRTKGK